MHLDDPTKERIEQWKDGLLNVTELIEILTANRAIFQFDYNNQAWTANGLYLPCNHPDSMKCKCFGKINAGTSNRTYEDSC